MEYADYIFFRLEDGDIIPIPREEYVALMHRKEPMPQFSKQLVKIAIFYVEMEKATPVAVINGTYNLFEFDEPGFADLHAPKHTLQDNRAFYEAVRQSRFDDIDCDPAVQTLRTQLGDEFSWVPTSEELQFMLQHIFTAPLSHHKGGQIG